MKPYRKIVVTHGGSDYELQDYCTSCDVWQVENGVWQATVTFSDTEGVTYANYLSTADIIKIYVDWTGSFNTQVFGGYLEPVAPSYTQRSETVTVNARGYGVALIAGLVAQEYGSQSKNPLLYTIQDVLTDATDGIVDKWVEKVLNTADNTEYTIDTTKVADLASSFRYFYWPYKPALNCLDDMLDYMTAANYSSASGHWIVYPSGTTAYLCLATIGSHENPPADVWPTWFNTDQTGSTIVVKQDMIEAPFTKLPPEANYIVYYGRLRIPPHEYWTEYRGAGADTGAQLWGTNDAANMTLSDDAVDYKIGSYSVQNVMAQLRTHADRWYYPSAQNLSLDVTKIGGEHNIPTINFYAMYPAANPPNAWRVYMQSSAGNEVYYNFWGKLTGGKWFPLSFPIGPYANQADVANFVWTESGTMDWTDVDSIEFSCTVGAGTTAHCHIDGLLIDGWVLRGARDDTKIGTQRAKIKLVVDDVAKDDTVTSGTPGTTDIGTMGRLAKAHLVRSISTPVVGEICIKGNETILPGQLSHIHFGKKRDTTYNIDSTMRILRHRLHFEQDGFKSYLKLTDDVIASRARDPTEGYNRLLKAVAPNFQDRERGSQKAREIDITQSILSENYST